MCLDDAQVNAQVFIISKMMEVEREPLNNNNNKKTDCLCVCVEEYT